MIKRLKKLYFTILTLASLITLLSAAIAMEEQISSRETPNSQDLMQSPIPTRCFNSNRPDELNKLIDKTYLSISTRSTQGFTWQFNGSSLYNPMSINDYKFIVHCLHRNEKNDFYFLDIGAGEGNWGNNLGKYIENYDKFPPNAKAHIISVTGDNYQSYVNENPRYTHYYFGAFPIENITEAFTKLGYKFDEAIDFAVSRYTFVHLHDPVGTFGQIYNMLRPETGIVYTDGFPVLCNTDKPSYEGTTRTFYSEIIQFLTDVGSPFVVDKYVPSDEATCRGLNPFLLQRGSSASFSIPYQYGNIHNTRVGQGVSGGIAGFIRKTDLGNKDQFVKEAGRYYGMPSIHDLLSKIDAENIK